MYFEHSIKTEVPVKVVYETLRDDLAELVDYIPNVSRIEVLERKKTKESINVLNKWYGKYQIPAIVEKVIKIHEIAWFDRAQWMNDDYACVWSIEPLILKEYVDVHGRNTYSSDGKYSTVKITGDINIDLGNYPLVPSILRKRVNNEISRITLALIKPNFTKLIKGLEQYIKAGKSKGRSTR
ncbi:MAG: hypothetical protein M1491_00410 [Deltaproteobacteria bacterium]|nr:hypothetical protein [Deltaproteobacteria bacterium]